MVAPQRPCCHIGGRLVAVRRDDWVEGVEEFVDPTEAGDWAAILRDEVRLTDECVVLRRT